VAVADPPAPMPGSRRWYRRPRILLPAIAGVVVFVVAVLLLNATPRTFALHGSIDLKRIGVVSHRGKLTFGTDQAQNGPIAMTLGRRRIQAGTSATVPSGFVVDAVAGKPARTAAGGTLMTMAEGRTWDG